jgi:hypothetical protein
MCMCAWLQRFGSCVLCRGMSILRRALGSRVVAAGLTVCQPIDIEGPKGDGGLRGLRWIVQRCLGVLVGPAPPVWPAERLRLVPAPAKRSGFSCRYTLTCMYANDYTCLQETHELPNVCRSAGTQHTARLPSHGWRRWWLPSVASRPVRHDQSPHATDRLGQMRERQAQERPVYRQRMPTPHR